MFCLWHLYIESTSPDPYLCKNIMIGVLSGLVHVVEPKMYLKGMLNEYLMSKLVLTNKYVQSPCSRESLG